MGGVGVSRGTDYIKDVLWFAGCLGEDGIKAVDALVFLDNQKVHSALQTFIDTGMQGQAWSGRSAGFLQTHIKGTLVPIGQRTRRIFRETNGETENLRIVYSAWCVWILQSGSELTHTQWAALISNDNEGNGVAEAKQQQRDKTAEDLAVVNEFWTKYGGVNLCPGLWWLTLSKATKSAIKDMSKTDRRFVHKVPNFELVATHGVLPAVHEWICISDDDDMTTIVESPTTIHVLCILALSGKRATLNAILQTTMHMKDATDYIVGTAKGVCVYKHLSGFNAPDVDKCVFCKGTSGALVDKCMDCAFYVHGTPACSSPAVSDRLPRTCFWCNFVADRSHAEDGQGTARTNGIVYCIHHEIRPDNVGCRQVYGGGAETS